ncbi:bifunctional biotin--[acetyl-CoA-carboxylase] ligase/biotin operon repressor BirA [Luteimonas aestuarii]|uniref:Bifunctional ligase/repressor BirA n=1 Tax=Luteimonas aestuarii TaxID=453837 RepID=A0A4R5TTY5_9GAMM|nr:bifunctional biotin--[acetyl-CoA-carboxylase] ligase/biotin operon repressor BirA [Luteimonas aestuarii]TDK24478.1 bifunctional biotin--[acetyl-CoA-carboxylase] ligase/biotin operon repressor BirA [Luteimonas aestuarii]
MSDRDLLQRLSAGPVSGDVLAREGGLTRAAVWKRIEALREAGVGIDAQAGRGYALSQPLDLLDGATIRSALPAAVRNGISTLEVAWSLDSTNARLLATPPVGALQVLLAERQTGGRGRRGRAWASPLAANLYLSVARRFDGGLARLGGLSLVAGIAVADALHDLGVSRARLKWPNDVVLRDGDDVLRKLGGVLVEGGGEHGGPVRAVIGIGLNVRMPARAARAIDQPWTDLSTELGGALPSRNALAAALLARLSPALQQFDRTGLAIFLPAYARHDALAGLRVTVHAHDGEQFGTALGLADDGALRVRFDAGGERSVHAGEISVRQAVRHG